MTGQRFGGAAAVLAAAVALALVPGAQAAAAPATEETTGTTHCVGGPGMPQEACFGSYREAISYATGGRITDAPDNPRAAASDSTLTRRMNALAGTQGTAVRGAIVFDGEYYSGASYTFMIPKPCVKNDRVDYAWNLNGWSNKITSVQVWSDCWAWFKDAQGTRYGPWREDAAVLDPGINNRSTLIQLS